MPTAQQRAMAENYRDAATERIEASIALYQWECFIEANYFAGLAVECIFRSYRMMIDPAFDARHDLDKLYESARFADVVPIDETGKIDAALVNAVTLWSNDHRFLSEAALRKRWSKRKLFRGIKGNFLKEQTRLLVDSAGQIVNLGVSRWRNSFKS
jgi:hypothetical protein